VENPTPFENKNIIVEHLPFEIVEPPFEKYLDPVEP
jgi:hypothetical protein